MNSILSSAVDALSPVATRARRYGVEVFENAHEHNLDQIRRASHRALSNKTDTRFVDLGCWDGANTVTYVPKGTEAYGAETSATAGLEAKDRGIEVTQVDLNDPLPWEDNFFDLVTSNQVIEHVADTDRFTSEAFRVLKPGGTAVISTENMSSWRNLTALLLGWQAFSLTNISDKQGAVGNPISLSRNDVPRDKGWQHLRIFSYRGLKELFEAHGFVDVYVKGAGYYPLPSRVAELDPRHSAFITVVATKPI